jgi:hypothetical protein
MGKRKKILKLATLYVMSSACDAVEKRHGKRMRLLEDEEEGSRKRARFYHSRIKRRKILHDIEMCR